MRIIFTPWPPFTAEKDKLAIYHWLVNCGQAIKGVFVGGLVGGHSGIKYPNLPRQSSAAGEYPATQSGRLLRQTHAVTGATQVEVGSTAKHAHFLMGTRKMAHRKMFQEALEEAELPPIGRFARFRRL